MIELLTQSLATEGVILLLIGGALAGLVRGFSGFGTALVFLPFAAQVYDPVWVLIVLLTMDIFGPLPALPRAWRDGDPWDVAMLSAGALLGLPIGLAVLFALPQEVFRYAISAIGLALLVLLVSGVRYRGAVTRPLVFGTGAVAGLFGGAVILPGPPVIFFYMARPLPVEAIRANVLMFLFSVDLLLATGLLIRGGLEAQPIITGLLVLPLYLGGILIGSAIFDPSRETVYRWAAYGIIAASAIRGLPIWGA